MVEQIPATEAQREAVNMAELRVLEAETLLQLGEQARAGVAFMASQALVDDLPPAVEADLQPQLGLIRDRLAAVARAMLTSGGLDIEDEADGESASE